VFELMPTAAKTAHQETVLYGFARNLSAPMAAFLPG
jgi:hypothetical protein